MQKRFVLEVYKDCSHVGNIVVGCFINNLCIFLGRAVFAATWRCCSEEIAIVIVLDYWRLST